MDLLKQALLKMLLDSFKSFDTLVNGAIKILKGDASLFNTNAVWTNVLSMSNVLKPFCYIVIGICLLIELAQVAAKVDLIKWEHGLKIAVKMCLSKVMIDTAPTFLKACYNQSALWISNLGASGDLRLGTSLAGQITAQVNNVRGLFSILGLLIIVGMPMIAIKVCGLLVQVIAFGRMFELYAMLCISPLPCAFFPLGDGSGGGFSRITKKFFMNFISVCLQGVMIIVCIKLFSTIMTSAVTGMATSGADATTNVANLCFSMLLGGIVLVMSCAKCGQWAKSVLDAN